MDDAVLVSAGGGEVIGDATDRRVEILSDHPSLNATWSRFGPRREGADLHVHHLHTDLFYVLAGALTLRLGLEDRPVVVPAGTLAHVPPDVVHGFRNGSDEELRFLNFHAPGVRFADYLRAMRDGRAFAYDQHAPPADGARPVSEATIAQPLPAIEGTDVRVEPLVDVDSIAVAAVSGEPADVAHAHPTRAESFYVLDGELVLTAGQRELRGEAGAWLQVPPGLVHSVSATRAVRYLDIQTPGGGIESILGGLGLH